MDDTLERLARGAMAGLVGTALMTVVIAAGLAARLLCNPPPRQTGANRYLSPEAFQVGWLTAHAGFGTAAGVVYSLARGLLPRSPVAAGLVYGGALWAVSYLGLMPSLGLYPWPAEDPKSRMAVMIAAHAVYGVTTAEAHRRLATTREREPSPRAAGIVASGSRGRADSDEVASR